MILRLSHSRAVVFAGCREEPRLKGNRGRARSHREVLWLSSGPRSPDKGEGLAHAEQEELISCDIIDLYTDNVPGRQSRDSLKEPSV